MDNSQHGSLFDERNFQHQEPAQQAPAQEPSQSSDNESTNIELHGTIFEDVSVPGLNPMDINLVAKAVNERIKTLERECVEGHAVGIDTLRLALMAAFDFAADLYLLQQESGLAGKATAKRIDTVLDQLQKTLGPGKE